MNPWAVIAAMATLRQCCRAEHRGDANALWWLWQVASDATRGEVNERTVKLYRDACTLATMRVQQQAMEQLIRLNGEVNP